MAISENPSVPSGDPPFADTKVGPLSSDKALSLLSVRVSTREIFVRLTFPVF